MTRSAWVALVVLACGAGCLLPRSVEDDTDDRSDATDGDDGVDARIDSRPRSDADEGEPDAAIDAQVADAPPPCVPFTCADRGASCGTGLTDGCGLNLDCGTCDGVATCGGQGELGVCAIAPAARECANGWCWEAPAPFAFTPTDVFARTTSDVWMIGTRGIIKHFDGTTWKVIDSGTVNDLSEIWMASATDGWIVGDAGTLRRWNGTAWTAVASGTTADLRGVHGTSATNVWFVGTQITKRWNGSTLTTVGTTNRDFGHVFVTAGGKVFGTSGPIVFENVSGAWTARTSDTTGTWSYPYFEGISGVGDSVYAVGGVSVVGSDDYEWVWHWDGTTWTNIVEPGNGIYRDAFTDAGTVFAPTEKHIWDMTTGSMTAGPNLVAMTTAGGAGGEVFAPTPRGLPWRFSGGTWTSPVHSSVNTSSLSLLGAFRVGDTVWFGRYAGAVEWNDGLVIHPRPEYIDWISGTGRDNVWAIDRDSFNQLATVDHFDGEHWTEIPGPGVLAKAIHATADEVVVLGDGVFHLDGTTWVAEPVPEPALWSSYTTLGADVYAVGNDHDVNPSTPHVAVRRGGTWSALPAPPTQTVCGIAVIAANDLWVTGAERDPVTSVYQATLSHWDGAAWTVTKPAGVTNACSIVATGGEVWVAGTGSGAVLRGSTSGTWSVVNGTASGDLRGLAVDGTGRLWAAGDDGVIMHR